MSDRIRCSFARFDARFFAGAFCYARFFGGMDIPDGCSVAM